MTNRVLAGRYQLIRQLGAGGFGQTFLAADQHLPGHPLCVVKQLQPKVRHARALKAAKRLFESEAQVLHTLGSHDQIPRLMAHFHERDEFYLVQEFIPGTVLSQELKQRQRLSEPETLDLLLEILTILKFVHRHQVIHRDIKPANLIRRQSDGKMILIDFGAVKQVTVQPSSQRATTCLTVAIGSSGYAPPEQLAGKAYFASDLYAAGIICIQALTGLLPHQFRIDADSHEICWHDDTTVNPALGQILDRMVCYDFRQRYCDVLDVLTDLASINRHVQATRVPPDLSLSWIERGDILFQQKHYQQALAAYDEAVQVNPLSALAWLKRGMVLESFHKYTAALTCYDLVIQLVPEHLTAWAKRGFILEQLKRPQDALASYRKLAQLQPQEGWVWYDQGKVLEQLEQPEAALHAYQRALELKPNFQLAIERRKHLLSQRHDLKKLLQYQYYDEALAVADQLLKAQPDNGEAWLGQGIALARQGKHEAALMALDLAVELQPNHRTARLEREQVLAHLNQRQSALQCTASSLPPSSPASDPIGSLPCGFTSSWKTNVLQKLKQHGTTIAAYNQSIQLNPQDPEVQHWRGNLLLALGRYEEAVGAYNQALQTCPTQPRLWCCLAAALAKLRRYREVVSCFDRVIQLQPQSHTHWYWRARALSELQRFSEALISLETALHLKPDFQPALKEYQRLQALTRRLEEQGTLV
jgi:tetratricopeptide (TPR) repeat protein